MENITEQFNAVALEYDWVTTLLEGKPDYLLDNLPDSRVSALDIGCGGGNTCIFLSSYFQHVTGIELSADFLQIAKDKVEKEDLQNIELLQDDFLSTRPSRYHSLRAMSAPFNRPEVIILIPFAPTCIAFCMVRFITRRN